MDSNVNEPSLIFFERKVTITTEFFVLTRPKIKMVNVNSNNNRIDNRTRQITDVDACSVLAVRLRMTLRDSYAHTQLT